MAESQKTKKPWQKPWNPFRKGRPRDEDEKTPASVLHERADNAKNLSSRSYYSYLLRILRQGRLYEITRRTGSFFSPLFFIYRVFRWGLFLLTWIETSAVLFLFSIIVAAVLPPSLVLFLSFLYGSVAEDKRYAGRLLREVEKQPILIVTSEERFAPEALVPVTENGVCFLFVVNNFSNLFRQKRRFFLPMCRLRKNVYLVRESLYFQVRDELLSRSDVGVIH